MLFASLRIFVSWRYSAFNTGSTSLINSSSVVRSGNPPQSDLKIQVKPPPPLVVA
jgi:hypothetical protein